MPYLRHRLHFSVKAAKSGFYLHLVRFAILKHICGNDFYRNFSFEVQLVGPVDLPHGSLAD